MKMPYRPLSMMTSVLGGIIAAAIFKKIWRAITDEEQAPKPDQPDRSWKEVATAAALQGALSGGVRAVVDRGSLKGFEKATGVWAGDQAGSGNSS
jgi:hypothetical protein